MNGQIKIAEIRVKTVGYLCSRQRTFGFHNNRHFIDYNIHQPAEGDPVDCVR
jgi:hypothetical protein